MNNIHKLYREATIKLYDCFGCFMLNKNSRTEIDIFAYQYLMGREYQNPNLHIIITDNLRDE